MATSCHQTTQNYFARYGLNSLIRTIDMSFYYIGLE